MASYLATDLASSGLEPQDIKARAAGVPELTSVGHDASLGEEAGYVIPYFDINGKPIAFYRVKLFKGELKYKQPKGTPNYVYFPPGFKEAYDRLVEQCRRGSNGVRAPFIIFTEGEKKAALAVKKGFPCVAFGGVDSWRTRTVLLPGETQLKQIGNKTKYIQAKLPSTNDVMYESDTMASGMHEIIHLLSHTGGCAFIVYDTDSTQVAFKGTLKPEVQRAAARLGYSLRFNGLSMDQIRQIVLPPLKDADKTGLDDFIMAQGQEALWALMYHNWTQRTAFPRMPNPKQYINKKLGTSLTRQDLQELSTVVITELDINGKRLRAKGSGAPFYFDNNTSRLMEAFLLHRNEALHESPFGAFLYKQYNLSVGDTRVLQWLASQFTAEEPIEEVEPRRIIAIPSDRYTIAGHKGSDCIAVQISDDRFAVVTPSADEPLIVVNNGTYGLMFQADQTEATNVTALEAEFESQFQKKFSPIWPKALEGINFKSPQDAELISLLFYISPYLLRWRGMQLPIEIIYGQPGSGKSSLFQLRLTTLTGRPFLRNIPNDIRDWQTTEVNSGGLLIVDNVQLSNKELRQKLSDEICRIVTEPDPHVEMRQLYTTSSQSRQPVRVVFGFTAVQQPFHANDFLQRSVLFELEPVDEGEVEGNWVQQRMEMFGGREAWLAHQLHFLHLFLHRAVVKGEWNDNKKSSHRLAQYEQALELAGDIISIKPPAIGQMLQERMHESLIEGDWTLKGLSSFVEVLKETGRANKYFTAADVCSAMAADAEYQDNEIFMNVRRLGRYMTINRTTIERAVGIEYVGNIEGRIAFKIK